MSARDWGYAPGDSGYDYPDDAEEPDAEEVAFWQWYARSYSPLLNPCRQCGAQTRNPALCIDCANDAEAGDVPY